ncbi:MAG: nucleotidyl transferase AbiEii/AbiGii toxin family protein [Chloroflexi bacterium]|nr:nucleotidyl transferase AbiEii/AbiGii toxin family protein [Chloroflexota bacterium]
MIQDFHWDALPQNTRRSLESVKSLPFLADFYLAGGTALALQIGHRVSHDLDFFSSTNSLGFSERAAMLPRLQKLGSAIIRSETDTMIYVTVMGVEVSFIYQHHPLLNSPIYWENVAIADLVDIGLMKLSAIKDRGTRRDFVDIYCLREDAPLDKLFDLIPQKYFDRPSFAMHLALGLRYFDDAEDDPRELIMKRSVRWQDVKKYCEAGAKLLTKRHLGLNPKGL